MKNKTRFFQQGFSMTELMVVLGIILVLVLIMVVLIPRVRITMNDQATQVNLAIISHAFLQYRQINPAYPNDLAVLTSVNPPYIKEEFSTNNVQGYVYLVFAAQYDYTIIAKPISPGETGSKYFMAKPTNGVTEITEEAYMDLKGSNGGLGSP